MDKDKIGTVWTCLRHRQKQDWDSLDEVWTRTKTRKMKETGTWTKIGTRLGNTPAHTHIYTHIYTRYAVRRERINSAGSFRAIRAE